MKILLIYSSFHHKNLEGLKLMCNSVNAQLCISDRIEYLIEDWDIIYVPTDFIEPEFMPNAKHILYGPHAFLFPKSPWNEYIFDSRCKYLLPSDWTKHYINETGGINLPIITLPFAVNVEKFKPIISNKYLHCIIYFKHRKSEELEFIESILKGNSISYRLFDYDKKYKEEDYIQALNECHFAIWLSSTESQGFALEECLSMNIPILVWNATSMFHEINSFGKQSYEEYLGKYKLEGTTIPYWDERCGIVFHEKEEFLPNLQKMIDSYTSFHPRTFVLEQLSPKICMERLLLKLGNTNINL